MVKAGLSRAAPPVLRTILHDGPAALDAAHAPDAVVMSLDAALPDRLAAWSGRVRTLLLYVRGPDLGPEGRLDLALPHVSGVVLGGCRDAGDLVRLGTRLAVAEAVTDRPSGSMFTIAELAPAGLLAPLALAAAKPRLAGLLWNRPGVEKACGATPGAFAAGGAEVIRTLLVLAGAALAVPVYEGVSDDAALELDGSAARRHGFAGKVAAHPAQLPALTRIFAQG